MAAVVSASNDVDAVVSGGGEYGECLTHRHVIGGDGGVSLESYRFHVARRTVMEMLNDRGYVVPDSELTRSLAEFNSAFGQNPDVDRLSFSSSLHSNPKKKIMVLFCGTDDIKKANAREIYAKLLNKDISTLMLVLQSKINSFARTELASYPFKVETFHISELLINITKHALHPKYQILTAQEKKNLLRKYKVEDKKLPLMLVTDAFVRYYGLEKGQVVKIAYRGGVAGSFTTYRCIV